MSEKVLVVASDTPGAKPLLKLTVLEADMPHPGWVRFSLASTIAEWEDPTICWYRVPDEATYIELQDHITDDDVLDAMKWSKQKIEKPASRPLAGERASDG